MINLIHLKYLICLIKKYSQKLKKSLNLKDVIYIVLENSKFIKKLYLQKKKNMKKLCKIIQKQWKIHQSNTKNYTHHITMKNNNMIIKYII